VTSQRSECLVRRDGERQFLLSPSVGTYTHGPATGRVLQAGESIGALIVLGQARALVVPPGVHGRVVSRAFERVLQPVAHGDVLLELAALSDLESAAATPAAGSSEHAAQLVFRAPSAGRFWLRPSPSEAHFVQTGSEIGAGSALGLIEVMKTFTRVVYRPMAGLPERARIAKLLVADGAEVADGDPLFELVSV
jgi:acetyl-CoA carboxylase biotin carboxyl carrier protein